MFCRKTFCRKTRSDARAFGAPQFLQSVEGRAILWLARRFLRALSVQIDAILNERSSVVNNWRFRIRACTHDNSNLGKFLLVLRQSSNFYFEER